MRKIILLPKAIFCVAVLFMLFLASLVVVPVVLFCELLSILAHDSVEQKVLMQTEL